MNIGDSWAISSSDSCNSHFSKENWNLIFPVILGFKFSSKIVVVWIRSGSRVHTVGFIQHVSHFSIIKLSLVRQHAVKVYLQSRTWNLSTMFNYFSYVTANDVICQWFISQTSADPSPHRYGQFQLLYHFNQLKFNMAPRSDSKVAGNEDTGFARHDISFAVCDKTVDFAAWSARADGPVNHPYLGHNAFPATCPFQRLASRLSWTSSHFHWGQMTLHIAFHHQLQQTVPSSSDMP